jgi:uncharacterized paraquat-inducible protein A
LEQFRVEAPAEELEELRQVIQNAAGGEFQLDELLGQGTAELHEPYLVGLVIGVAPVVVPSVRMIILGWLEHRRKMAYLRIVDNLGHQATTADEAIRMMKALPKMP